MLLLTINILCSILIAGVFLVLWCVGNCSNLWEDEEEKEATDGTDVENVDEEQNLTNDEAVERSV